MLNWFIILPLYTQILITYLIVINIVTFFYFGIDKIKSQLQHRRISEKMLWILSAIGGSIGALIGMNFFRHKTKKLSFQAGIAVILAGQILLIYLIYILI